MKFRFLLSVLSLLLTGLSLQAQTESLTPEQRFFAAMAEAPQDQTKTAGGSGGKDFKEVFPDGGILVGFDVWQAPYGGAEKVIYAICPIYQTLAGRQRGKIQGSKPDNAEKTTIEAKDGDAVSSISIRTGSVVDGLQLQFRKIDYFGFQLTASNSYRSDTVGGDGGAKRLSPLTSNGRPIVGIYGGKALALDRIGLIYADKK